MAVIGVQVGCSFSYYLLAIPLGASFKAKFVGIGFWRDWMGRSNRTSPSEFRIFFLRSTLFSLPTYFLSAHIIPIFVTKRPKKLLQRDFLWGETENDFRYHLVVTVWRGGASASED
ncbi:hypothetical protein U1Q18_052375 [Sarracenia purpurea var. burkii]